MKKTMLTAATLDRFEKIVNVENLDDDVIRDVEHLAYCANMGAGSDAEAWERFAELLLSFHNIDVKAAEWAAESDRVEAATLAALAPVIASQDAENVTAFFDASDAQEAQQEPEKALTPYERVISKNPDCPNAWRLPGYPGPVYTINYTDAAGWWSVHFPSLREYQDEVERIRKNGGQIEKTTKTEAGETVEIPAETRQEQTDRENRDHCRRIAEAVELYAGGMVYKCPHCGQDRHFDDFWDEEREDPCICPDCGEVIDRDELENLTLYDYFSDCLDVEYRCGSDREYRSACIMIACGGPNIYIDTATKNVELYWWTDRATYPLSYDAAEAVDDWAREYWDCI